MDNLLQALDKIDVSKCSYSEWCQVGMALKSEGYDVAVWDNWSKNDKRYKEGECEKKWATFNGSSNPITGATIIQMARNQMPMCLDWNDVIEYDGDGPVYENQNKMTPVEQLTTYLDTLFQDDEYVGYVTNNVWQSDDKWMPSKGVFNRTKKELVEALKKHPDDLGAAIGDWKEECGAWIRFNPLDGKGVKNENVTRFSYALVESDNLPILEQYAILRKLQLPIATLTLSGGKSLHAIVHVDANDENEYRQRVDIMYDFLDKNGMNVDRQNRNPSRLSRLPGVTRGGNEQTLIATNIGRKSFLEWLDFVEGNLDELPSLTSLSDVLDNPPVVPPELISGVLRVGHKMIISGPSKAGKSFSLMELCVALSEGTTWLGFKCKKSKVLYVNLEIDPASCIHRFIEIYKALKMKPKYSNDIVIWNLRGYAVPLDKLVPKLVRRIKNQNYDAVIIDPIYKVITGDENNASEMGSFCNQFDKICSETGCSAIYCHHHSKGAQGQKSMMDRSSGSGVFARDPDAIIDLIELVVPPETSIQYGPSSYATPWRVEGSLREFLSFKPFNVWFNYPLHVIDDNGILNNFSSRGTPEANLALSGKRRETSDIRKDKFDNAFDICSDDGITASQEDIAKYLNLKSRTIRDRIKEFSDEYSTEDGIVTRKKMC